MTKPWIALESTLTITFGSVSETRKVRVTVLEGIETR